jgi:hypothetical protein
MTTATYDLGIAAVALRTARRRSKRYARVVVLRTAIEAIEAEMPAA